MEKGLFSHRRATSWFGTVAVLVFVIALIAAGGSPSSAAPNWNTNWPPELITPEQPGIVMVPGTVTVSQEIADNIRQVIVEASSTLPVAKYYTVSGLHIEGEWYFISVVLLPILDSELGWKLTDASWFGVVVLHVRDGIWSGAIEGSIEFSRLLADIPETILSSQAKQSLDPLQRRTPTDITYTFPWGTNTKMQYGSNGVHDNEFPSVTPGWKAVDFLSDGDVSAGHSPNNLITAAPGTAGYVCQPGSGENTTAIRIGDFMYTHLIFDSSKHYTNRSFGQGESLGSMRTGDFSEHCGYADNPGNQWFHVHLGFPDSGTLLIGGWTLNLSTGIWQKGSETHGVGWWFLAENGGSSSCSGFVTDEVRLYDNFNCGGNRKTLSGTGLFQLEQMSFNDLTKSLEVGMGWSARLFKDNSESSPNVCIQNTDSDLRNNNFSDGTAAATDQKGETTWVRVYDNSDCGGVPPSGNWWARYFDTHSRWDDPNNWDNQRCEDQHVTGPELHQDYGDGSPCTNMDGDDWVGDYQATINFSAGDYVFRREHDDGFKLWVNGQNIADIGGAGGPDWICPPRQLNGETNLRVLLREDGGGAKVHLTWTTDTSVCGGGPTGEWWARYFDTHSRWDDPNNWDNQRCEDQHVTGPELHQDYGDGSPCTNMDGNDWVGDYQSTINFPAGNYVFRREHDDGFKLWVNGQNIADIGGSGGPDWICPARYLSGNTDLRVLLREDGGSARVHLTWTNDVNVCNPPPDPPSLNSPANGTTVNRSDSVTLVWNTSSGATEYYAEFWGGPDTNINSGWRSGTTWSLGPQWGGSYQWRVKARNSVGESGWSETRTLTVKYGSPSNLIASGISESEIQLSWSSSADAPGNIDGYRIYRSGTSIGTVTSTTTLFTDSGLDCGSEYTYYVKAYKGSIESDASNTASATPACSLTPPVLLQPENGAVLADRAVTFAWLIPDGYTDAHLRISESPDPENSPWLVDMYVDNDFSPYTYTLPSDGTFYWHMRTMESIPSDMGSDWVTRSFGVDTEGPSVAIDTPASNSFISTNYVPIRVTADDSGCGVVNIQVFVWYDDALEGSQTGEISIAPPPALPIEKGPGIRAPEVADWHEVGQDSDGSDGWGVDWDASGTPDQNIVVFVYAFDCVWNYTGTANDNIWLDRTPPVSSVDTLPANSAPSFTVGWSGTDAASGIAYYDVQYQDNGGPWTDWQTSSTDTWAPFAGTSGHTYGFRGRAYDLAGNVEGWPSVPDAVTTIQSTDNIPPYGQMTAPERASVSSGPSISVAANASDDDSGVNRVVFYAFAYEPWADGQWVYLGTDSTAPYTFQWDVSGIDDGFIWVSADIYDNAGNSYFLTGDTEWTYFTLQSLPPTTELEALEILYNSTDGPNWINNSGWLSDDHPCTWYGITCADGHITILNLITNNLDGTIPPELGNLTYLQQLWLQGNNLQGSIPVSLGSLTDLEVLNLDGNQLSGSIPPNIGGLTKLEILGLQGNQISGEIPSVLGNLVHLQLLFLNGNLLTGPIPPEIGNLTALYGLFLNDNALTGDIPSTVTQLSNLDPGGWVKLGFNMLTASDPDVLAFLDSKAPGWDQTQTVPPTNIQATTLSANMIEISWTPIDYIGDGGYYEVGYSTTSGGSYAPGCTTAEKITASCQVSGLLPNTTYYFAVRTYTPAHDTQQNDLWSAFSEEAAASTPLKGPDPLYDYHPFPGYGTPDPLPLYPYPGNKIALLVPTNTLDHATIYQIVATFDAAYNFYAQATGREPVPYNTYNGLATIAVVPSTCGAGCGYLGYTGIEILASTFDFLYDGVANRNEYDQVVFYELGRNFWFYDPQLAYKLPDDIGTVPTGFAVFMRFMSMEATGVTPGPYNGTPFADFKAEVIGLLDTYLADPSYTWHNTLRVGLAPTNSLGLGGADMVASFLFELRARYGDAFVMQVWQEAGQRPPAATTQDAVDNFIISASIAARQNLADLFVTEWRWPLSETARDELETLFPTCHLLSLSHTGSGADPVAAPPQSAGCELHQYIAGENIGLTADPAPGWQVGGWSGTDDDTSTSLTNQLTMPGMDHDASVVYIENPPDAPSNLTAIGPSQTQIDLAWTDNSTDETNFRVERSPNGTSGWAEIGTVAADVTAFSDDTLTCGTPYFYRVRAFRSGDSAFSTYSNVATATTQACPLPAPSDLSATAVSQTQIDLAWTDNSSNEDQFVIERAPEGTENWTEIATVSTDVTTYSDTTAACGSAYRFRVYASNAGGVSDYSNVAEATTLACPVDVPTLLLPVDGSVTDNSTPTFFWTGVSGGHAYRIQIDDSPDFSSPVEDALVYRTYHTPLPLASGITYSWRVRVENSGSHAGEWSDVWTVTVDTTVLPAPLLRTPKDGSRTPDTTPRFRWNRVKNAARYRLQIADTWTFDTTVVDLPLSTTAYTLPDTDALAYGQYFWRVQALIASGNGGTWSDPFTLTITILASPKDGASTTNTRPTFKWAKAQEATGYRLQVDDNSDFTTPEIDMPLTARKYRPDTPLPVGNYFWRVQVITGTGNDTWMPAWTLTITPKPPARPKLLAPAKNAHTNNTTPPFAWWAVAGGHTYQLQVDTDRRFRTPEVEVWVAGTSFTPGPLADGTYFWRVRAFNDVGVSGPWSAKWKVRVDTVAPAAPLLKKPDHEASLTAARPTLRWRTVSDAVSYEVQLDPDPLFPLAPIAVGKRTSYRPPTPLVAGNTYSWRVRAIDKAGNISEWSEVRVFHLVASTTSIETPEPASAPPVLITPTPSQPAPPHKPDGEPATPELPEPPPGQPPRSPDDPERPPVAR